MEKLNLEPERIELEQLRQTFPGGRAIDANEFNARTEEPKPVEGDLARRLYAVRQLEGEAKAQAEAYRDTIRQAWREIDELTVRINSNQLSIPLE